MKTTPKNKAWMVVLTMTATAGLLGCSSGDEPPFTCAFGELTGTWRIHYVETNGNCGEVADETVVLGATQSASAQSCTSAASTISTDKCRLDTDFTCPTTDNKGEQHWIGTLQQVGESSVSGSMTVQVNHTLGTCRSTYTVTWSRQ